MSEPSGEYGVDEVTVILNDVEILKGDNAKGAFIRLGNDGRHTTTSSGADGSVTVNAHHDERRPLFITVLRSSPSNQTLGSPEVQQGAKLRIERKRGGVVFEGHAFRDAPPPRNDGDERQWKLVAVGKTDD